MLQLFSDTSFKLSKRLTNSYSTSFSWGIKAFSPEYRDYIYAVYGYVRLADEIVDSFHGYNKAELLNNLRKDTWKAIDEGISTNPILQAFQITVNKFNIDKKLIEAFLKSMEMDLSNSSYKRDYYDTYIYGSAEVVGLMCLKVFIHGDQQKYDELKFAAKQLGSAFQKVNFLRDIKSDIQERGRIYLPDVHEEDFITNSSKRKLEDEVENEFRDALIGIMNLPIGVKLGVYSAYLYYYFLFKKIKSLDVDELLNRRVRISNFKKFLLLLKSIIEVKVLRLT
jgi:phytoene/squalene synthetase